MLLKGDRPLVEPAEEEGPGLNEPDRIEDAVTELDEVIKELQESVERLRESLGESLGEFSGGDSQ